MKLAIKNLMSIQSAQIEISGTTVIAGMNGAGKSTILRIAAALACRQGHMMTAEDGSNAILVKQYPAMVRNGCKSASASLFVGDKHTTIKYPSGDMTGESVVRTDPLSCGRILWHAISEKEHHVLIERMVGGVSPTEDEFRAACEGIGAEWVDFACKQIAAYGFDKTETILKSKATELRGEWKGLTGETYGDKKAENWGMTGQNEEALAATVAETDKAVSDAIGSNAVSKSQREDLQETAKRAEFATATMEGSIAQMQIELAAKEKEYSDYKDESSKTISMIESISPLNILPIHSKTTFDYVCPACGTKLVASVGGLEMAILIDENEIAKRKESNEKAKEENAKQRDIVNRAKQEHGNKLNAMLDKISSCKIEITNIRSDLQSRIESNKARSDAIKRLAELPEQDIDLQALKDAHAAALRDYDRHKASIKAKEVHTAIKDVTAIAAIVARDGLRATVLEKKMAVVNGYIKQVVDMLGISQATLDSSYGVVLGGIPFQFLSEAQQHLTDIIMQWAFALHHKPELVIMDRVGVFVGELRKKVIVSAKRIAPNVMIGLSDRVDYAKAIAGHSAVSAVFWVEDGTVDEIGQ